MVILKSSKLQNAAKKLQQFLLSPVIQKHIKADGYGVEIEAGIESESATPLKGSERERH